MEGEGLSGCKYVVFNSASVSVAGNHQLSFENVQSLHEHLSCRRYAVVQCEISEGKRQRERRKRSDEASAWVRRHFFRSAKAKGIGVCENAISIS